MVRLDNIWGVGGGIRPVKYLIKKIIVLLKEYLCSGDAEEARRCLMELEVPHFHHELVYEVSLSCNTMDCIQFRYNRFQAVVMAIEAMHEKTEEAMCKLLKALFRSFVITIEQMKKVSSIPMNCSGKRGQVFAQFQGFERVYDQMPEMQLDVPQAYVILERFVMRCKTAGFITDEMVKKMPSRGRKRFVSEGDGGVVKEYSW